MKRLRRWLRLRRPSFGGLVRATAVISLVIALVMATPAVAYYDVPGINGIASKLAGRSVTVRCLDVAEGKADAVIRDGASGYVSGSYVGSWWVPYNYAVFAPGVCEDIVLLASQKSLAGHNLYDLTFAVMVLTHESGHLRGAKWSDNESKTQCWAMQHLKGTMNMLRIQSFQRDFMFALALEIQGQLPFQYQFLTCKGVT